MLAGDRARSLRIRGRLQNAAPPPGFTLIEILVVLVILGLALSIVAGFAPIGRSTLNLAAATDIVANTLRLARVQAITRQQPVLFTLVAAGNGYAVDGTVRSLPNEVSASMDRAAIRFTRTAVPPAGRSGSLAAPMCMGRGVEVGDRPGQRFERRSSYSSSSPPPRISPGGSDSGPG